MPRLRYSANGLIRALVMTRVSFTAFVEGMLDRLFYGELLRRNLELNGSSLVVRLVRELDPALGSGKSAMTSLFVSLRRRRLLISDSRGKRRTVVFFMDKDVDDLRRTMLRSSHVIYTEHYSVENYIYRHGNLQMALAAGANLDPQSTERIGASVTWTRLAASCWSEWVAFCLLVTRLRVRGLPNYGVESLIHPAPYQTIDPTLKSTLLRSVASKTGLTSLAVQAQFDRAMRKVNSAAAAETLDQLFNGKWYRSFLSVDARRIAAGRQLPPALEERLEAALVATVIFDDIWADNLQRRISDAATRLRHAGAIVPSAQ